MQFLWLEASSTGHICNEDVFQQLGNEYRGIVRILEVLSKDVGML